MAYQAILGHPISGQDVTAYLEWDSWAIAFTYGQRGATAKFYLTEDIADHPKLWNVIVRPETRFTLYDTTLGVVIFGGVIVNPKLTKDGGPLENRWELACQDYTFYANNRIVFGDYSNKTLDFIIKDLNTQANCGITTNGVNVGPMIARCVINNLTLTEAWSRACEYASQGSLWGWFVDDLLDLHVEDGFSQDAILDPMFSDSLADIQANPGVVFPFTYDSFSYEWAGESVRNRIKVRGGSYTGTAVDKFSGTSQQSNFSLTYPVNTGTGSGSLLVTVAGTPVSASIDNGTNVTTPVPAGTCVFTQTPSGAWFIRFGTIPTSGQTIVAQYQFLMPVLTKVDDVLSQIEYSLGPNTLANPGFEKQPATADWGNSNVGSGTAVFNDTLHARSGLFNAYITNPSTGNYGGMFSKQGIPVVAGEKVTVSAYIKANAVGVTGPLRITLTNPGTVVDANGLASAQPSTNNGGGGAVSLYDLSPTVNSASVKYSTTITIPVGFAWLFLEIYGNGNGTPNDIYWDDIAVRVATPNAGIFEMYISDPTITDILTAKARGLREIAEYARAEERVEFYAAESNDFHLHIGDVVTCTFGMIPELNSKVIDPVSTIPLGITGEFLVVQLRIEGRKGPYRVYQITGVRLV